MIRTYKVHVLVLLLILTLSSNAGSSTSIPEYRAVNAILGEAEGEGAEGMLAVACAIRNRGTLRGVYGEKAPRVVNRLYSEKSFYLAKSAWVVSETPSKCEFIDGATHWEGTAFPTPSWAKKMTKTTTIKNQNFYKEKK